MFYFLFPKAVKIMMCMAVTVIYHALPIVNTTGVTYSLDTVLHANLDGLVQIVLQVCQFINLSLI